MNVGILTFHRAHNYGALLQAFALKKHLEILGHQVAFVDYWPDYHNSAYQLIPYYSERSFLQKISGFARVLVGFRKILKRRKGYLHFIRTYIGVQKRLRCRTPNEIQNSSFDCIIYGSDQIWRKHNYRFFKGFDDVYFGFHIPYAKKITYAASMGEIYLNNEDKEFILKAILNFNSISVREKELLEVVEEYTDCKPELVMDPVFLLQPSYWNDILPGRRNRDKYVLLYQLKKSTDSIDLANRIAQIIGCQVIEIQAVVNARVISNRYKQTASPLEFLSLIKGAEFVVSTSFHGTAFSIIFEKQFYATGMGNNSGRARSLLSSLDIADRYITYSNELNLRDKIDYVEVKKNLTPLIISSKAFLEEALNDD